MEKVDIGSGYTLTRDGVVHDCNGNVVKPFNGDVVDLLIKRTSMYRPVRHNYVRVSRLMKEHFNVEPNVGSGVTLSRDINEVSKPVKPKKPKKCKVIVATRDGRTVNFRSGKEAAEFLGVKPPAVSYALKNKNDCAGYKLTKKYVYV